MFVARGRAIDLRSHKPLWLFNVAHAKFGQGVILGCEGNGADARVQVKFRDTGVKWLALEYAKLTAA